jgi:hypothetical protein
MATETGKPWLSYNVTKLLSDVVRKYRPDVEDPRGLKSSPSSSFFPFSELGTPDVAGGFDNDLEPPISDLERLALLVVSFDRCLVLL